jgi:hypothetical protein
MADLKVVLTAEWKASMGLQWVAMTADLMDNYEDVKMEFLKVFLKVDKLERNSVLISVSLMDAELVDMKATFLAVLKDVQLGACLVDW